ncbi:MAG: hypothetical protein FD180_3247 [Planctomycetota bacterium]|nr:MAG: hypothetical protein FD180_3247 [Planctomycetota bacterium]
MAGAVGSYVERRDAGFEKFDFGLGAREVQIGRHAGVEARLGEVEDFLLAEEAVGGDGELALRAAEGDVVARDLGDEGHEDLVEFLR